MTQPKRLRYRRFLRLDFVAGEPAPLRHGLARSVGAMSSIMARTLPKVAATARRRLAMPSTGLSPECSGPLWNLVSDILDALYEAGQCDAYPMLAKQAAHGNIDRATECWLRVADAFKSADVSDARVNELALEAIAAEDEYDPLTWVSATGIDLAIADATDWADRLRQWAGWRVVDVRLESGLLWQYGDWGGEDILSSTLASKLLRHWAAAPAAPFTLVRAADCFEHLLITQKMEAVPWLKAQIPCPRDFVVRMYCLAALTLIEASLLASLRDPYRAAAHAVDAAQACATAQTLLWSYSPEGELIREGEVQPKNPRLTSKERSIKGGKSRSELYSGDRETIKRLWEAWKQSPLLHQSDNAFLEAALLECHVYSDTTAIRFWVDKLEENAIRRLWEAWQEVPHLHTEASFLTAALKLCRPFKGRDRFVRKQIAKWEAEVS